MFKNYTSHSTPVVQRDKEYKTAIEKLINCTRELADTRIIIVEGNGPRKTFLDDFGVEVVYTYTNRYNISNYGLKEYLDIQQVLHQCNIHDDELVIKMTGRYLLEENSPFLKTLMKMSDDDSRVKFDCLIRYGSSVDLVEIHSDCITGLIGMRCRYIKQMEVNSLQGQIPIERSWASASQMIPTHKISNFSSIGLGIIIKPSGQFSKRV